MRVVLLSCLMLLAACQGRPMLPPPAPLAPLGHEHADLGRIVDLASGRTIDPEQLLDRLARAERVLVGEQHDNPDHHALQLWLLRELFRLRPQGSVLMEMLNPDQQNKVDQAQTTARAGQAITDPFNTLAWQPGWDWSLYGPLVMHQLRQPYPLLAANLDRAEIMQIYRQRPTLGGSALVQPRCRSVCWRISVSRTAACCRTASCRRCLLCSSSVIGAWPRHCWLRHSPACCWPAPFMCARISAYPCTWLTSVRRTAARC